MPFFQGKPSKTEEIDVQIARCLRKLCRTTITWSEKGWANQIRILRNQTSTERVEAVIKWLEKGDHKVNPTSARWLARNFKWLEEAAKKDQATTSISSVPPEEMEAYLNWFNIKRLLWPEKCQDTLHEFLTQSYANYREFKSRLKDLNKRREEYAGTKHRHLNYTIEYVHGCFSSLETFLVGWVGEVHAMSWDWEEFSGNLKPWIWRISHPKYVVMATSRVESFTNGGKEAWTRIVELMGYRSEK